MGYESINCESCGEWLKDIYSCDGCGEKCCEDCVVRNYVFEDDLEGDWCGICKDVED